MTLLKINLWVVRTDKKCGHGSLASAPCQDHVNWCGSGRTLAYRRLLRARRERPRRSRAAEQRDEVASLHVGHGLLPRSGDGPCDQSTTHLACRGPGGRLWGRPECSERRLSGRQVASRW